jgi:hypothetical protein
MADDPDISQNQKPDTDREPNDASKSADNAKNKSAKKLKFPKIGFPKVGFPKVGFPKFKFNKPSTSGKKNFLWFWLLVILISYVFIGYFLSVLLTIPTRKNIAIAGFAIAGAFPTITGFADYALMKWGYLLSGILIIGGLVFLAKAKFYFIFLAIMLCVGTTTIAFVGETLIKQNRKFLVAIVILTIPCLLGLAAGWQIWKLAATHLS